MIYKNSETLIIEECESTQTEVKKKFLKLTEDNHVEWLQSKKQSQGRGRRERMWSSPDKGHPLFISAAFDWPKGRKLTPLITLIAGYSLYSTALRITGNKQLFLKWPNDLCYLNKENKVEKIAGTLVEVKASTHIIGWGVNIDSTPEASFLSQSIQNVSKEPLNGKLLYKQFAEDLKLNFLNNLNAYLKTETIFRKTLINSLRNAMDPIFNQDLLINGEFCRATKLEPDGNLTVIDARGQTKRITSSDIEMVSKSN